MIIKDIRAIRYQLKALNRFVIPIKTLKKPTASTVFDTKMPKSRAKHKNSVQIRENSFSGSLKNHEIFSKKIKYDYSPPFLRYFDVLIIDLREETDLACNKLVWSVRHWSGL